MGEKGSKFQQTWLVLPPGLTRPRTYKGSADALDMLAGHSQNLIGKTRLTARDQALQPSGKIARSFQRVV